MLVTETLEQENLNRASNFFPIQKRLFNSERSVDYSRQHLFNSKRSVDCSRQQWRLPQEHPHLILLLTTCSHGTKAAVVALNNLGQSIHQ